MVSDDNSSAEMRFYTRLVLKFCFPTDYGRNGPPGGEVVPATPSRACGRGSRIAKPITSGKTEP